MSIDQIKRDLIDRSLQVVIMDLEGNLQDSDHSLVDFSDAIGKDLFLHIDALFGLKETVVELAPGDPPLLLPIISFQSKGEEILLNLEIHRREADLMLVLYNHDRMLSRLRDMQQERNDSMILLERIRKQDSELKLTNERLKSANKELDNFAYVVSHDLKTPLRGIRNLSDWIEEGLESGDMDEVTANVRLLKDRSLRMEEMIDAILQYSRAGRDVLPARKVNVKTLVQDAVGRFDPEGKLELKIEGELPVLTTQANWLSQVFSILISNAIDYGKPTNGQAQEVGISCQIREKQVQFSVSDEGPGISKEHHQRVFEVFETLGQGKEDGKVGIGLSIARKLVSEAGGEIWIEPQEEGGTTVSFTWPSE